MLDQFRNYAISYMPYSYDGLESLFQKTLFLPLYHSKNDSNILLVFKKLQNDERLRNLKGPTIAERTHKKLLRNP